jgi:hypothetical protein
MTSKLVVGGAALAALTALAACSSAAPGLTPAPIPPTPAPQTAGIGDGAPTYVSQFRKQFPTLAEGKSDGQILSDGEADCADMAAARELTTPAMAHRHGLGNSTADKFTLTNAALLATFTLCGLR